MRDLIDRQELIDAFEALDWYHVYKGRLVFGANSDLDPVYRHDDVFKTLRGQPSVGYLDAVNRQDVIVQLSHNKCGNDENDIAVQRDIETVKGLPPAQLVCSLSSYTDAVDREYAIRTALEFFVEYMDGAFYEDYQKILMQRMKDLPPILPHWIPTSKTETIPDHEVLCCDKYDNQMIGYLTNDDGEWICESDSEVMYDTIAWMEKPSSYKELDDD